MKIKLKWIVFSLLFLCSCVGNGESEKNNNIDTDSVATVDTASVDAVAKAVLGLDPISAQNIVEVALDSISANEELIRSYVYMKNTPSSYPFDRDYTLRPFMLFKNVDPNYPDTPDSIASLLSSLKAEIHENKLILTNDKTDASCEIYMSFGKPFEWNSETEKHYYFYNDKLDKYGSYMGDSVLSIFAENDIEECFHYANIYVYGKYIIMEYLNAEMNCSLWFFNPWYEEKCKILARSKDTIDHFFEDEVIPFESINVDTTQRVICSTESIFDEWNELETGDDDKYYHIIHETYDGYKCYVGEIPNGSAVKILPIHAHTGYNVMIVCGTYGADSGDYWSLYVYKDLETINQASSSIEVRTLEEADPFENEGDYRISTFKIYEDFTIRVDGERRIGSVVDKVTRYYRITDQGEIREVEE
ncbi:MAG: hypothetical protein J6Y37_11805 [Paludibacteraceae bacterium]|nr:hypothetical protein [Paludibacteraceae bacterium]